MPDLALAIAVKGSWNAAALTEALKSAGCFDERIEIHLACDQPAEDQVADLAVHLVKDASLFRLWGIAIAHCSATFVAILHAHAPPAPGWGNVILDAIEHRDPLCGPVEPAYTPSDRRIVGYLVEYCQFHRPVPADLKEVPGNNLVVPRVMLGSPSSLAIEGFSKTRMLDAGVLTPRWTDEAIVHHDRPFALRPFCLRRFRHGRAYGATKWVGGGTSRRALAAAQCFALPAVRVIRIARHAWRHASLRKPLVRHLPAILLAEGYWSAGEFIGIVSRSAGDETRLD